jgi:hypothetical protein
LGAQKLFTAEIAESAAPKRGLCGLCALCGGRLWAVVEVEYDLLLARDLGFLPAAEHSRLSAQLEEVRRMLSGLMASLKS